VAWARSTGHTTGASAAYTSGKFRDTQLTIVDRTGRTIAVHGDPVVAVLNWRTLIRRPGR
jgi:hypothetical protein